MAAELSSRVSVFEGNPLRSPEWRRWDPKQQAHVTADDLWRTRYVSDQPTVTLATLSLLVLERRWSPSLFRPALVSDAEGYAPLVSKGGRVYRRRMHTGRRYADMFAGAWFIALDFDKGLSLRDAMDRCLRLGWRCFLGTSRSHGVKPGDRFRIVVELDRLVTDPDEYHGLLRYVVDEVFPEADPQCIDVARFFFGCQAIVGRQFDGRPLSVDACLDEVGYVRPVGGMSLNPRRRNAARLGVSRESGVNIGKVAAKPLKSCGGSVDACIRVLSATAPGIAGQRGSVTTYRGILAGAYHLGPEPDPEVLSDLAMRYLNPRCVPVWDEADILQKVLTAVDWVRLHPSRSQEDGDVNIRRVAAKPLKSRQAKQPDGGLGDLRGVGDCRYERRAPHKSVLRSRAEERKRVRREMMEARNGFTVDAVNRERPPVTTPPSPSVSSERASVPAPLGTTHLRPRPIPGERAPHPPCHPWEPSFKGERHRSCLSPIIRLPDDFRGRTLAMALGHWSSAVWQVRPPPDTVGIQTAVTELGPAESSVPFSHPTYFVSGRSGSALSTPPGTSRGVTTSIDTTAIVDHAARRAAAAGTRRAKTITRPDVG